MFEILTQWHSTFLDTGRVPDILGAVIVTVVIGMITGPLAGNAKPFFWLILDLFFGRIGDRLDRKERKKGDLVGRGFFITTLALILFALIGQMMALGVFVSPYPTITRILLLSLIFTSGSLWFVLLRLYFAMDQGKVTQGAYYGAARTTRRNLSMADDYAITRAAMGMSVRTFDKGLVAPALWYLIGGFPFVMIYTALAAASWRFGKDGFGKGFAAAPLALERLLGMIPSILSALIITISAGFTPTAKSHKAIVTWMGAKGRASYEEGGLPVSALAWALNVSLGGAYQDLSGSAIKGVWVGPQGATAKLNPKHLRRAIYINAIAHIVFAAMLLSLYVWGGIL